MAELRKRVEESLRSYICEKRKYQQQMAVATLQRFPPYLCGHHLMNEDGRSNGKEGVWGMPQFRGLRF